MVNELYGSCDGIDGIEEACSEHYSKDEGSYFSCHNYEDEVRYNFLSHMSYEPLMEGEVLDIQKILQVKWTRESN